MRTPTDRKLLYRYWAVQVKAIGDYHTVRAAADAGRPTLEHVEEPQSGFYKRRKYRGGPYIPVRIFVEQQIDAAGELIAPEIMKCQVGPDYCDPVAEWPWVANRPISQATYRLLLAEFAWAKSLPTFVPDPEIEVDFLTAPPPLFKKKRTPRYDARTRTRDRRTRT